MKPFKNKKFEAVSYLHLIIIILLWTCPLWLDWKLIIVGIFLYYMQLLIFGDCILTKKEFKSKKRKMTFYSYLLEKMGFNFDRRKIAFIADYIFPYIIWGAALIFQVLLSVNPLINL